MRQHGAPNIAALEQPPQRVVVVISEFGALCATAQAEGVLDEVLYPLSLILREAGAAGVHVLIEDQVVDQRWPRGISANAEPVTGYLPVNYGAAGGYYDAHKLAPYQFHFAGTVFGTWPMAAVLPMALAGVQRRQAAASSRAAGGGSTHVNSNELAHELAPVNSNELAPAAADSWYEWTLANYLPAHPELLQTDASGRGIGVKALGEAMAEACGKDYESMKGMASGVAKRLRGAHPAPRSRQEQQEEPCTPYMH